MNGGLPRSEPSTWLVFALAAVFVALGLLFLFAPRLGAALFGIPAPDGIPLFYLPAIGLRDLAFGLYLAALALRSTPRTVALILFLTVLIPFGDIVLVAIVRGIGSPYLLVHGLSAAALAFTGAWLLRAKQRSGSDA